MTRKRLVIDAIGYSALVAVLVVYKRIERHDDYLAVAVGFLLLIPVGLMWRVYYRKLLADASD